MMFPEQARMACELAQCEARAHAGSQDGQCRHVTAARLERRAVRRQVRADRARARADEAVARARLAWGQLA